MSITILIYRQSTSNAIQYQYNSMLYLKCNSISKCKSISKWKSISTNASQLTSIVLLGQYGKKAKE